MREADDNCEGCQPGMSLILVTQHKTKRWGDSQRWRRAGENGQMPRSWNLLCIHWGPRTLDYRKAESPPGSQAYLLAYVLWISSNLCDSGTGLYIEQIHCPSRTDYKEITSFWLYSFRKKKIQNSFRRQFYIIAEKMMGRIALCKFNRA